MTTKSVRAIEIDELVHFIRTADIPNARQSLVKFLHRDDRVSHEILTEYQRLEHGRL